MALVDGTGSGEFVRVREWSCSQHDYPQRGECDCCHCDLGEWDCDECSRSDYVDAVNEDGTPKMRELTLSEATWRNMLRNAVFIPGSASNSMISQS